MENVAKELRLFAVFARLPVALFGLGLTASGFLFFSPPAIRLALAAVTAFFSTAAVYSYNQLTDTIEDRLNRRGRNYALRHRYLSALFGTLGLFVAAAISPTALLIAAAFMGGGFSYSFFRTKRYFVVKNLLTTLGVTLLFVLGVAAARPDLGVWGLFQFLRYYAIVFLFVLILSLLADIRDYFGDVRAAVGTLPVVIGYDQSKIVAVNLITAFVALTLFSGIRQFLFILLFTAIMSFFLGEDSPQRAHFTGLLSFILLPLLLIW